MGRALRFPVLRILLSESVDFLLTAWCGTQSSSTVIIIDWTSEIVSHPQLSVFLIIVAMIMASLPSNRNPDWDIRDYFDSQFLCIDHLGKWDVGCEAAATTRKKTMVTAGVIHRMVFSAHSYSESSHLSCHNLDNPSYTCLEANLHKAIPKDMPEGSPHMWF